MATLLPLPFALSPRCPVPRAPCCLLRGVPPSRVPFPGPLLVPVLSPFVPCPRCLPLPPSSCPAPLPCTALPLCPRRWLPLSCSPSRWPRCPSAARCPVLPALPLSASRHWAYRCAPLPTPPALPGALTLSSLTPSPTGRWCPVPAPGAGGNGAGAPRAPAPRTAPPASGAPPFPPPPALPH